MRPAEIRERIKDIEFAFHRRDDRRKDVIDYHGWLCVGLRHLGLEIY